MAFSTSKKGVRDYCDTVYTELTGMKSRLDDIVKEIKLMKGPEADLLRSHIPHLVELSDKIGWKLDLFLKVCPSDWKGYAAEFEPSASVLGTTESIPGGYPGG
ncbi:MAG TPA: hypothetical protein VFG09_03775 [Thermodesulfovibrionales bacterium]|nr:hypothetical protein [Thermodesulfovibrionales bacterium]